MNTQRFDSAFDGKRIFATAICAAGLLQPALAQTAPAVLTVEVTNVVGYLEDTSDLTKFATLPNATPSVAVRNFAFQEHIGDIVAVNGQPVKGTLVRDVRTAGVGPSAALGEGIADVAWRGVMADVFEFLSDDGSVIGTFVGHGPAQVSGAQPGIFAITGGTGAFLGALGQYVPALIPGSPTVRTASVAEDPANRRQNGGGHLNFVLQVIPLFRPEIVMTVSGPNASAPAVVHSSDFSLVTAANPAKAGEYLSVIAKGLGPVHGNVAAGQAFPASPLATVVSPVSVQLNGTAADSVAAVGYPGSTDSYQVNFRVPANAVHGNATLQLSAAWIPASTVSIAIQ